MMFFFHSDPETGDQLPFSNYLMVVIKRSLLETFLLEDDGEPRVLEDEGPWFPIPQTENVGAVLSITANS